MLRFKEWKSGLRGLRECLRLLEKSGENDIRERARLTQIMALGVVRTAGAQRGQGVEAVDVFADDLELERMRELRDRRDHLAIKLAAGHTLDEAALDLDQIDRQVTQMRERGE